MGKSHLIIKLFLLNLYYLNACARWTPVVDTKQGKVRGVVSLRGDRYRYLGIPYASIIKRFQGPGEPLKWTNVFSANKAGPRCAQILNFVGSETDCLYLNVYTPSKFNGKNVPVMVFIHGGGFYWGSSDPLIYEPEPLVSKGVVVVTINYRLGPFGFLCLGIEGAEGNAGLKDQVAALKWVNQNIKGFGGDPTKVTIFGQSAGSSSVELLILSPAAKGLFHRAIMQSGSALSIFAFDYNPVESAIKVALRLGFNTKDPEELLKIFQNATTSDLLTYTQEGYIFKPCVEKRLNDIEPFLDKTPYQIMSTRNYTEVPMIIGYTNREGIRYAGRYKKENKLQDINNDFQQVLPTTLDYKTTGKKEEISEQVKVFYFHGRNVSDTSISNFIDLMSDIYVDVSVVQSIYFHLQSNPDLYTYYFKFDSTRNLPKFGSGLPFQPGASHGDDLFYLFQPAIWILFPAFGENAVVMDRMTTMWTNFAKVGNPTPKISKNTPIVWPKNTRDDGLKLLSIDSKLEVIGLQNEDRINFWLSLFDNYGRKQ